MGKTRNVNAPHAILIPDSDVLILSQVTASHLKIGYPKMKSTGTRSWNELQWLDKDGMVFRVISHASK